MHVVTFYSFKGGVGRTLAVANVASELMKRGNRVLVVDFDLEAPGLPTFEMFQRCATQPGIVEYVTEYLEKRTAPEASKYTFNCDAQLGKGGLWFMSAGLQDSTYSARLNSINWEELYSKYHGFLLFEDLKEQWKRTINPDYVLIDSRTGHTDVAGICTRQLPDAVVAMFFPNAQNQVGLEKVVSDIRSEATSSPAKDIKIHFVASNVPNLDDDEQILQKRLEEFQTHLEFEDPTIIHHYSSLKLLDQEVFVQSRAKSKLALEYQELTEEIIRENVEDREGVLAVFETWGFESSDTPDEEARREARLSEITSHYANDGEILLKVAEIREADNELDSALALFEKAIALGHGTAEAYIHNAMIKRRLSDDEAALKDYLASLEAPESGFPYVMIALRGIAQIASDKLKLVLTSPAFAELSAPEKNIIAERMRVTRGILPHVIPVFKDLLLNAQDEGTRDSARANLILSLIGDQKYQEAIDLIRDGLTRNVTPEISGAFNLAMATWGLAKTPDADLFRAVIRLSMEHPDRRDANFNQCLALAYHLIGQKDEAKNYANRAAKDIRANPRQEFSAWRYLIASPNEFAEDLKAMEFMIDGGDQQPRIFTAHLAYDLN